MNWYKKAQIQETLPYFQEFEDMGEYVPNEEKLSDILQNKYNTHIISDIGQGDSGIAYLLSNGEVLKITTNQQEGKVAKYFVDNPSPHIISYKEVWKDGDLYYIIMDKLDTLVSDTPNLKSIFDNIHNIISKQRCLSPDCAIEIVKKMDIDLSVKQPILLYLDHLLSIPINIYDFLNSENIGIKDGKIVFFDVT